MHSRRTVRTTVVTVSAVLVGLMAQTGAYATDPPAVPQIVAGAEPRVLGTSNVGQTLQVTAGTWTSATPVAVAYAWQRCLPNGVCEDIAGAVGSAYTITAADHYGLERYANPYWKPNPQYGYPYRIRAIVTATNAVGSTAKAASAVTPVMENDTMIGGTGGGFDTMIENGLTKPMDRRFNVTMSQWWRHCLGFYTTEAQRLGWVTDNPAPAGGVRPGNQAIRFEIQDGDIDPVTKLADRQRCEVMGYYQLREGAETWTRFQYRLENGFPFDPTWNYATKWYRWQGIWSFHTAAGGVSGPAGISIRSDADGGGHFELVDGNQKDPNAKIGPNLDQTDNWIRWRGDKIQLDHWYDFVIHTVHSSSNTTGRMELWIDGAQQTLRDNGYRRTLADEHSYPTFGLYRDSTIKGKAVAYGDGYAMGLTPQSVGCTADTTRGVVCAAP